AAHADCLRPATRDATTTSGTWTASTRARVRRCASGPRMSTPRQPSAPTTEPGLPTPPTSPAHATRATPRLGVEASGLDRYSTPSNATGRSAPTSARACSVSGTVAYAPSAEMASSATVRYAKGRSRATDVKLAPTIVTNTTPRAQPGVPSAARVTVIAP